MAVIEENWQKKRSTIAQRITFIFNSELLSDVKFVVPVLTGESESKKVIPAHKFVLAISSPVFFAMFYGQMVETKDSIELPDCEYESLLEFFRFLYSDELNLSGSNVMQVLYLANKYMVPSLAERCTKYLRQNLNASNVFCILPHVQKFQDKDLEDRCWEVIEMKTGEAVTSDEFVTVERSLVESVVKREGLNVKEVELFKAVDCWATKESERQGITPDGDVKRRILGEEIVKAIRFPLMSEKEFASVVIDSDILTPKEVGDMMKHYNDVLTSPLSFIQAPRIVSFHQCHRFETFLPPLDGYWGYATSPDCINFTVNKPIRLHGVQHFGSEGGKYTISTEVKDTTDGSCLVQQSGSYTSKKDKTYGYFGFDVQFDSPVYLKKNKEYKLVSLIKGPNSWSGGKGKESVESQGVRITFRCVDICNGTTENQGWNYSVTADCINFTVNKPIKLHGVQHFGSEGEQYTVSTEVKDATDGSCLVQQSGSHTSKKDKTYGYFGFEVRFDSPANLKENKEYKLVSLIQGPTSWCGEEGKESVESKGVRIAFRCVGTFNGTTEKRGQFPTFFFS